MDGKSGMNAGKILNSTYEIQEKIGAGGGGTIYKAFHKRLQKEVVLKKIHKSSLRDEGEKEILKNLKHSYLPQVFDFLDVGDGIYTVIDYIPGQSFEKLLKVQGFFSQKKVVRYGIQLCEAVEYLHKQKPPIIHGDIKPANIMLTPEDNICLIDFNISGVLDGHSMEAIGYTFGYAPPEQVQAFQKYTNAQKVGNEKNLRSDRNEKTELLSEDVEKTERRDNNANVTEFLWDSEITESVQSRYQTSNPKCANIETLYPEIHCKIDERSDIYSIGATLYHLLTGIKPSGDPFAIRKPMDINPEIGESISIILMKALCAKPEGRFQTVSTMREALQKIHKYDRRYKRMILKQEILFLSAVTCVGMGILFIFFGNKQIAVEKEEDYVQAISILSSAVDGDKNESYVDQLYTEAINMKPERLEAYFQKAVFLYKKKNYEDCQKYIENMILSDVAFYGQKEIGDVYFLLANCYFEQENYVQAIINYRSAISKGGENPEYYRDYVIALARNDEVDVAREILASVEKADISSVDLMLVNGELAFRDGDFQKAEENFLKCIDEAEDDDIRLRAYVMCDKVYRKSLQSSGGYEKVETERIKNLQKSMELLEKARIDVGQDGLLLIFESLAQTYIDLQEVTSEDSYGEKALMVLQDIVDHGWSNYTTYNNMAILYQKLGQLEQCAGILDKMLELDPKNYVAYKRQAFLEVEKQNRKKNAERSYGQFLSYYARAKERYAEMAVPGGDTEIQLLDNLHQQLIEGGWIK